MGQRIFNYGKRGQIWVETVVYTLIGLALIGLVLAILTPQIKESRDETIIDQTINSLIKFDTKIKEVLDAPGNRRKVEFGMNKGNLYINSEEDYIKFELNPSNAMYSEPGISINVGVIEISTLELSKGYNVVLKISYPNYDITFNGGDGEEEKFTATGIPYNFFIENKGFGESGKPTLDITESS
ncbi:MAG: hypothetical protein Q8P57_02720 [Candidatus Pacearchaeota archaeon]|nr:hypothetical protein [Candidatus Pacearchaeota archaeon]